MVGRSRRQALTAMLGAGLAGRALAAQPTGVAPSPTASDDAFKTSADLKTRVDAVTRMTAPVKIAGQGPLQFLVDTGADRTTVSRELAERLQLQAGPPVLLHGVAGVVEAQTAQLPLLEVGDRRLIDVIAPVLAEADLGAEGLLGIDSLKDQRLLLDFKRTRMVIQGGRRFHTDPAEVVVKAKSRFGQLTLVDAWLEREPIVVIIDSGAESTIANGAFRDRVTRLRRKAIGGNVEVLSVTGQSAWGDGASIPSMKLGQFTVRNLPVIYADLHTFARWGVQDEPAMLLGVDVLRQFETVWIDFIRREVRFRLPPDSGPDWSERPT